MKICLVAVSALLLIANAAAAADTASLESIACVGANGLKLKSSDKDRKFVETQLGIFEKTFELSERPVQISEEQIRISLGEKGESAKTAYDIYLKGELKLGVETELKGVIGQTYEAKDTGPKGEEENEGGEGKVFSTFRPVTYVQCKLIAR